MSKLFVKQFENFKGLDTRSSDLTRQADFAVELENYDILKTLSIIGRRGHRVASQHGPSAPGNIFRYPYQGIKPYVYKDSNGVTRTEIVGVGNIPYRLRVGFIYVQGPEDGSVTIVPEAGQYKVILDDGDDSPVTKISIGTGLEESFYSVGDLVDAIDAVDDWSVISVYPSGVVDGAQNNRSATAPTVITNKGALDWSNGRLETPVPIETTTGIRWVETLGYAAGTQEVNYNIFEWARSSTFNVLDGALIGAHLFPATILLSSVPSEFIPQDTYVGPASTATWAKYFYYWSPIMGSFQTETSSLFEGIVVGNATLTDSYFASNIPVYSMRNNSNVFFIGMRDAIATDNIVGDVQGRETGLVKYDGHQFYAAGMPSSYATALATDVGGDLEPNSRYRYLTQFKHVDAKGNVTYGKDSTFDDVMEITTTAVAAAKVTITLPNFNALMYGNLNCGLLDTSTASQTMDVRAGHSLRNPYATFGGISGDAPIFLTDRQNDLVRAHQATLSSVDTVAGTITLVADPDDSGVVVADDDPISQGVVVEIYRTKAGGTQYYLAAQFPYVDPNGVASGDSALVWDEWEDTLDDDDLGELWLGPYTGMYRRDVPPVMPIIENHQGGLVGGGGPVESETIYWSGVESVEYYPESTNLLDLSSTETGPVTAIASDSFDILDVFKANSMVVIAGDLTLGNVSIVDELIGDIGCPSLDGWQKVRGSLLVLSNKGPRIVQNGQLLSPDDRLITFFTGNFYEMLSASSYVSNTFPSGSDTKFVVSATTSVHDYESQRVLFHVPCLDRVGASKTSNANANSRVFVYDYANDYWTTYKLNKLHNMMGGMAIFQNKPFWVSRMSVDAAAEYSRGCLFSTSNDSTEYDFHDNCLAIPCKFRPQWEFLDEPSMEKDILKFKIWSMNRPFDFDSIIDFKSYLNFKSTTADTITQVTLDEDKISDIIKFKHTKACAYLFSFESNTVLTAPHITGFEYEVATPYDKEHIK